MKRGEVASLRSTQSSYVVVTVVSDVNDEVRGLLDEIARRRGIRDEDAPAARIFGEKCGKRVLVREVVEEALSAGIRAQRTTERNKV